MIVCQLFVFIKFYGFVLNGIFAYLLQDGRRATAEHMSEDVGPSKQVLVSPPSLLFVNCSMCEFVYTGFYSKTTCIVKWSTLLFDKTLPFANCLYLRAITFHGLALQIDIIQLRIRIE
jgi:hypothetical protein